jgi:hypothetical protein
VHHREQKAYAVTSPVRSDVCVHGACVGPPAPVEVRIYPYCLVPDNDVHDREASGVVALACEAVGVHVVAVVCVVVDCWMVAKVAEPRTVEAGLPKSIQLVAPVPATYAAAWRVGDDAAVARGEVERAATAVVVSRVQTQG